MENDISVLSSYAPLLLMVVLFYFLLYRPQKKQQQKHQDMLNRLEKGSKVVTRGGILGTVEIVKERTVKLRVAPNTVIEVAKDMIGTDYVFGEELEAEKQARAEALKAEEQADKEKSEKAE